MKQEEIKNKADELGQKYFPDSHNIWARANIEAQYVSFACIEMANWMQEVLLDKAIECADKAMIDKACEHLAKVLPSEVGFVDANIIIINFRKAMEE